MDNSKLHYANALFNQHIVQLNQLTYRNWSNVVNILKQTNEIEAAVKAERMNVQAWNHKIRKQKKNE